MAQRYTQPLPRRRMAAGTCPECGGAVDTHLEDPRFWVPRSCDLTRAGVTERIAQYQKDLAPHDPDPTPEAVIDDLATGPLPTPAHPVDGGLPTHGRLREDRGSHTEADAGAFERAHAYRPSRLEEAMDRGYDPHEEYR